MSTSLKVAVIGAGPSGLLAARELHREAHQVVVFEKSHRLGGIWVYDPRAESDPLGLDPNREIVHGTLYKSMRTNLPRQIMSFTDFKFNEKTYNDPRQFPGHEEVLKFLEDFAISFELTELIRFNSEVTRVELVDSGVTEFVVESRTSGVSSEEVFDAVVVCNGHLTQPLLATDIPAWFKVGKGKGKGEGKESWGTGTGIETWPKKQMHSHNYRVPQPFQDQTVVIIGSGPSALDISREIATVAKEVHMSSRSPDVKFSKLEKFNNIWQHSKIDCITKDGTVTFQDGFSTEADIIFHCTGFKYQIPFLKTKGIVKVQEKRIGPLYKHVFAPQLAPRLSFVGLLDRNPGFPILECQSKWIAQTLSGKVSLPSEDEMLSDIKEFYREMEEQRIPEYHTHSLRFKLDYMDWVSAQFGMVTEKRLRDLYEYIVHGILNNIDGYRDALPFEYGK